MQFKCDVRIYEYQQLLRGSLWLDRANASVNMYGYYKQTIKINENIQKFGVGKEWDYQLDECTLDSSIECEEQLIFVIKWKRNEWEAYSDITIRVQRSQNKA